MYVIVDKREYASGIPRMLEKLGVEFRVGLLSVGDYLIEGKYIIERKSIHDLLNSIKSARIFRQLSGLIEVDGHIPVLIVEGDWRELERRQFRVEAIYGFLLLVQNAGIRVIYTQSKLHTAVAIKMMSENEPATTIVVKPRRRRLDDPRIAVLCGIPGVGVKKAQKLLKRFKTVKNVANATWAELADCVGPATADKIKDVLETEYE